jgi:hypothetical protein
MWKSEIRSGGILLSEGMRYPFLEGIFVTWSHQNDIVWMLSSTLTAKTNGGG